MSSCGMGTRAAGRCLNSLLKLEVFSESQALFPSNPGDSVPRRRRPVCFTTGTESLSGRLVIVTEYQLSGLPVPTAAGRDRPGPAGRYLTQ
jgi:hypothetical protein